MQGRMKQHQLTLDEITDLLKVSEVGRIATNDPNGFPYIVPVHFVYLNEKIYIHGLIKGQKIDYLKENSKVGFEIDEMGDIIPDDKIVCNTNTTFRSVIILGYARIIEEAELKNNVLNAIVNKYTPQLAGMEFPPNMFRATGIIEVGIKECTGKYYK